MTIREVDEFMHVCNVRVSTVQAINPLRMAEKRIIRRRCTRVSLA